MWKTVVESLRSDQKYILELSQIRYKRLEREYDSVTRYAVRKDEQGAQLQATITKLEQDNAKWMNKSFATRVAKQEAASRSSIYEPLHGSAIC
jgi:hypothetical protein